LSQTSTIIRIRIRVKTEFVSGYSCSQGIKNKFVISNIQTKDMKKIFSNSLNLAIIN